MTDARSIMLARIRGAIADGPAVPVAARDYRHTGEHPPGSKPLLDLLTDRLVDYKATVHRTTPEELASTLDEVVRATLPEGGALLVPPGLEVGGFGVDGATTDHAGLTWADLDGFAGVLTACAAVAAETGTIALDGSPDQGRRAISLVPDRHICVVRAEQVVQTVPELVGRLDPRRPLTFISGPSATSDIELQRVEGVHGPRTLVVVLVAAA